MLGFPTFYSYLYACLTSSEDSIVILVVTYWQLSASLVGLALYAFKVWEGDSDMHFNNQTVALPCNAPISSSPLSINLLVQIMDAVKAAEGVLCPNLTLASTNHYPYTNLNDNHSPDNRTRLLNMSETSSEAQSNSGNEISATTATLLQTTTVS